MSSIVETRNLRMYYTVRQGLFKTVPVKAVDGVSMNIKAAETLALVGESGCGKTSLGRTTLRLLEPVSGELIFKGKDITHDSQQSLKWLRRDAQIIFQDPYSSINPYMNIHQIMEEPLIIHKIEDADKRTEMIYRALEEVRLYPVDEVVRKYPHMLSGGQRQRVTFARALLLDPTYIVADEPVSMIDASSRVELLQILSNLQKLHNLSILYITHDISTAKYVSNRLAVMYVGKMVERGDVLKVIGKPLHPYTQGLIASVPDPDPSNRLSYREVIPGEPPNAINPPAGCRFHTRCPHVMPICSEKEPKLIEIEQGQDAACFLYHKEFVEEEQPGDKR
ncbi:ABC transporter ATP-binding protein [Candidatus Bathyarchaeota archaeon]|nr:ABC transporter ATP-binding protein [Candidatus Bathyarchaeota archaeon]MBL7080105.1 ABC transporter ATP-binding protein [Candidatus Bathyarchaeota archaeon]